jgi:hypothetical protein
MSVEPLTADPQPQAAIEPKISVSIQSIPKGAANRRQRPKGGLQGMLQRNREREAREVQDKSTNSNSLNAFLQDL